MLLVDLQYIIFLGGHVKSFRFIMLALFALTFTVSSLGFAQRGSAGEATILYWQAVSIPNPYLSGGTKDLNGASVVLEPLASYDQDGNLVPRLVDEIPTVANGGVSEDLTSITWKLTEGILWSDGTPLTAADVVFTGEYCMNEEAGCQQVANFADIESIEAVDDLTIKITFGVPKPFPYGAFVSQTGPIIQAAQFADCLGAANQACTEQNFAPIGTGPFTIVDFRTNDVVVYEANENYREANKPAFQRITLKGGGDAASSARAVLETGEADYGWNLQVTPEILNKMAEAGQGEVLSAFGSNVERLMVNLTNPDSELGDDRSVYMGGDNAHPFLVDPIVREALSLAIDREILTEIGYGAAGQPTCNVVPAPAVYVSTANDGCLVQDIEKANQLLDDAGWVMGNDGVRVNVDGLKLSILYQTSTNAVRQETQALVKQWWNEIGVTSELRNIDASVFFGGDPSSPDTFQKFYADIEMYTNGFSGTDPEAYFKSWTCEEIPTPDSGWLGSNMPRYCNPAYDALVAEMAATAAIEDRAVLGKAMNDLLVQEGAMIPLIHRGSVSAKSNSLTGVAMNAWDSELWNIADWGRSE